MRCGPRSMRRHSLRVRLRRHVPPCGSLVPERRWHTHRARRLRRRFASSRGLQSKPRANAKPRFFPTRAWVVSRAQSNKIPNESAAYTECRSPQRAQPRSDVDDRRSRFCDQSGGTAAANDALAALDDDVGEKARARSVDEAIALFVMFLDIHSERLD